MQISTEEKLAQLERILHGRTLHGAESLRGFLRFVVERAASDQEQQLKEYVIATEVFGRGRDFDSRIDSVVRVQAGRLRTKLLEYYATEGKNDPIILDLPKGQYTPVFAYAANISGESPPVFPTQNEFLASNGNAADQQAIAPLWGEMLKFREPVLVVFSNTIFHGSYDEGMKLFNSLDVIEHNSGSSPLAQGTGGGLQAGQPHPQPSSKPMIDHYTGIGELMSVHFLGDFLTRTHHPYRLKRSLLLTWDDAKIENIVVLGSPAENLFLLDLPQQQDFIFRWMTDEDGHHVNAIVNTKPQPDEQEVYRAKQFGPSPSQISEDYAVVSLLRGLNENNRLLILAGINTFGTQAATEYVTRPESIKDLISHLNLAPEGQPPQLPAYYQVLLRVKVNGGVPVQTSYVTHHVLKQ